VGRLEDKGGDQRHDSWLLVGTTEVKGKSKKRVRNRAN